MAARDTSNQSYLSRLSPWGRSPNVAASKEKKDEPDATVLKPQKVPDHVISHRHRISLSHYPKDCPPMRPQWFHAVDVPKRRPHPAGERKAEKAAPTPKKYAAFSTTDSKAIEAAFQKLIADEDADAHPKAENAPIDTEGLNPEQRPRSDSKSNPNLPHGEKNRATVPVSEDYLFDVDIEKRELAPAYWMGPVYDVRRGTWFYQDGSVQRPCDENLAAQLEEGYLKVKAWRFTATTAPQATKPRSASQPRTRPASWAPGRDNDEVPPLTSSPKGKPAERASKAREEPIKTSAPAKSDLEGDQSQNSYRLFGAHMNSVVTYQDASTAWLLTDDFMSRMNYTMYQHFAGGGHFGGMKMTRGYVNPDQKTESKEGKPVKAADEKMTESEDPEITEDLKEDRKASASEKRRMNLHRQMSSFLGTTSGEDRARNAEEMRKRNEEEMEEDYREAEGDEQGREIEHLILVTHGIGQRLGLRLESVNFVHDVNTLRKTLKAVYAESPDLRALNAELENDEHINSRIQVLPICWRHLLDFPRKTVKQHRKEHDVTDQEVEEDGYPSLEDITVDGVPAVRNLITDLALDILIYDSPIYKQHITSLVLRECNRTYHLFTERHPNFNGKISFIGHSLGSTIMFDLLCNHGQALAATRKGEKHMKLDFEVEDFYALGSPIGLFQMLGGRKIGSLSPNEVRERAKSMDDPTLGPASSKASAALDDQIPWDGALVSRPKCAQVFNIFHPTDPISYRMEPLISPAMAALKPQPLPYTKRGIFGAPVGQGLTGIGARVSQSVSSMWSSVASSLLTRGLGYGDEPAGRAASTAPNANKSSGPLSFGANNIVASTAAGTNATAGIVQAHAVPEIGEVEQDQSTDAKLDRIAEDTLAANRQGQHPPTLIDTEIETLYGDFQKRRRSIQEEAQESGTGSDAPDRSEIEAQGRKLRREEAKVRRLNRNGRVDYAIQEGAFDINLIAAIASHLSYWSDEDVSHFIISQLLSRHRKTRTRAQSNARSR